MGQVASLLWIAALNVLIIKLYFSDDLTLYIHPRYLFFTWLMNVLSLLIVTVALTLQFAKVKEKSLSLGVPKKPKPLTVVTAILIVLGLVVPPTPLLSSTVSQRLDEQPAVETDYCTEINPQDPPRYFQQWHSFITTCNEPGLYRNQPITLEGFVFKDAGTKLYEEQGVFMLARFRVSCCAVDVFPLLLPIQETKSSKDLHADEWVRVKGVLKPMRFNDGVRVVVEPVSVDKIPQPKDPYEFISY